MLILDEPTNHLDIEWREALEDALRAFPGAILLVSHDRALLDAVGTRTVAVEDGALRSYEGGWPEYVRVRDERRAGPRARRCSGTGDERRERVAPTAALAAHTGRNAAPAAGTDAREAGEARRRGRAGEDQDAKPSRRARRRTA